MTLAPDNDLALRLGPDVEWAPYLYTPRINESTHGDLAYQFGGLLKVSKGFKAGERLTWLDWQRWLLQWLLEHRADGSGLLRYRQAVVGLPRKTGKSLIGAGLALYFLVGVPGYGREIYSVAGDRQQAKLVFGEARWQVEQSQWLSKELKTYRDAIEHRATGSVYRVLSHEGKLAQGLNPFLTLADETHVYPNEDLYQAMLQGSGARPESLLVSLTTAGDSYGSLLGRLHEYGRSIAMGETNDPTFGIAWWQAPPGRAADDEQTWFQANPNLSLGLADMDEMRSTFKSTPEPMFRRYRLNQWVPHGGLGWMDMEAWKNQERPDRAVIPGESIALAFDGSVTSDTTALVGMTMDGHVFVIGAWEADLDDSEWQVPRDEVNRAVEDAFALYDVRVFQADTAYWKAEFDLWQETFSKRRVLDFTMSHARMVPAVQEFYAGIKSGAITHSGDSRLTRHVGNAVVHETPRGVTIKKEKKDSPMKIDLAVAACIANDGRLRMPKRHGFRSRGF